MYAQFQFRKVLLWAVLLTLAVPVPTGCIGTPRWRSTRAREEEQRLARAKRETERLEKERQAALEQRKLAAEKEARLRDQTQKAREQSEKERQARVQREREERLRKEQEEKRRQEQEIEQRLARLDELGFNDWSGACDLKSLYSVLPWSCISKSTDYSREQCNAQLESMIKKRTLFSLPVIVLASYDRGRKRFKLQVSNLLFADGGIDPTECWKGCEGTWISTRALQAKGSATNYMGWVKRFVREEKKHLAQYKIVYVDAASIATPETLESRVKGEALVRVVGVDGFFVGDWFNITNVRVKVVGLRVSTQPDLEWGAVLVKDRVKPSELKCEQ